MSRSDAAVGGDNVDVSVAHAVVGRNDTDFALLDLAAELRHALNDLLGGFGRVTALEVERGGFPVTGGLQDRRCHTFHEDALMIVRDGATVDGVGCRGNGTAAFVAEHDDEGDTERIDREGNRSHHGFTEDLPGGTDDEDVAETGVEDELDGDAGIRAGEHDRDGILPVAEFFPAVGIHVGVVGGVFSESLVSGGEQSPGGRGSHFGWHGVIVGFEVVIDSVLSWFEVHERDLPWRVEGTSAWGVLLSEVMSQQTPVARVAPLWEEWMRRWPEPQDLAAASTAEVLRQWGSLGYPRRALRLQECAATIVSRHAGRVPDEVDDLLALPGIGDYTARAVACFAFGKNVPVVDTNVRRVYRRSVVGEFLQGPARKAELQEVAALLPDDGRGPRFAAALMELGALVCTAANPACDRCPLHTECAWVRAGRPEPHPEELAKAKKRVQKFAGTDRQVRGLIMKVLREADAPVEKQAIDVVWPDAAQRSRALFSLIDDGLAVQDDAGYFHLPR